MSYTEHSSHVNRRSFLRLGVAAGVGTLAGCTGGEGETLTIGATQPLSGGFAAWGQAHEDGLAFAVQEINDDGGVLGRDLEVSSVDTESNPTEAATQFERLVESDGAIAITGPVSSDVGIRTRQTAEQLEVPLVLHMAGSHKILPKDTQYTFRMGSQPAPIDLLPQFQIIEEQGYETVGAITGDYEWGNTVQQELEAAFPAGVDLHLASAPTSAEDFASQIREMPDSLDMMIATGHPPGSIAIHTQALELGRNPEITTGAGFPPAVLQSAMGETAVNGFTHLHVSDPTDDQFQEVAGRFREETGGRFDTHEAYGYVAGQLIATAAEEAGEADPVAIADAVRDIQLDTVFSEPLEYTDYGELDGFRHHLSGIEPGAPEYYPDGEWRLTETFKTPVLEAFDPDDYDYI